MLITIRFVKKTSFIRDIMIVWIAREMINTMKQSFVICMLVSVISNIKSRLY